MSDWIEVDGAYDLPIGRWIVTTGERNNRDADIHIAIVRKNLITIGGYFSFDMPKVIAYMKAPLPFEVKK